MANKIKALRSAKQKRLEIRNTAIRQDFKSWDTTKYRLDHILTEMEKKWYLAPDTIYRIILFKKPYDIN